MSDVNLWRDLEEKVEALDPGFTPENVANKATSLVSDDNTHYPTTRAIRIGAIVLLATPTVVDLDTTTAQDLYQVPAGKSLHVMDALVYGASVDLSGYLNSVAIIDSASLESVIDDFTAAQWAFLADASHFHPSPGHAGANPPYRIVTAGNKVRAKPSVAFGSAATVNIALFGYLY